MDAEKVKDLLALLGALTTDQLSRRISEESQRELAAERERCCKAQCKPCGDGFPVEFWPVGNRWIHRFKHGGYIDCDADEIRRLGSQP